MTGRRDQAWLVGLALTLTDVDEFLRSPAGHAALTACFTALALPKQTVQQHP